MELCLDCSSFTHSWYTISGTPFPEDLHTATPLQIAAFTGHIKIAEYLLERGASTNTVDNNYWTPLHFAAAEGQTAMIELLLDSGSNLHAVDKGLQTACMVAASRSQLDSLRVLVTRGAKLQMQNGWGQTVLHLAAYNGYLSVFHLFMKAAPVHDLGQEDRDGDSPLSLALYGGTWHEILFVINLATNPDVYVPRVGNILNKSRAEP